MNTRMKYTGYIEGYYGKLFSWEERKSIVEELARAGLNTYVYAPKEDPWHRIEWKTPYPAEWARNLKEFVAYGKKRGVNVILCLAPGLSYQYESEQDYSTLVKKITSLKKLGVTHISLLMDDVSLELPKESRSQYRSLGEAHGMLMKKLYEDVPSTWWFCPTVYATELQESTENKVGNASYLSELSKNLPKNIFVFWTGEQVISEKITLGTLKKVRNLFPKQLILWDNYYANDYCPRRLFLDGLHGRSLTSFQGTVQGFLLNPTGLPNTDRLYLSAMSKCMQGKAPAVAWKETLLAANIPKEFFTVQPFLEGPFERAPENWSETKTRKYFNRTYLEKVQKSLTWLNFTWKSPYQVEWYPFLHGLNSDIERWKQGASRVKGDELLRRRFPALLQNLLFR